MRDEYSVMKLDKLKVVKQKSEEQKNILDLGGVEVFAGTNKECKEKKTEMEESFFFVEGEEND